MDAAATTRLKLRVAPGARHPGVAGPLEAALGVDVRLVAGHASRDKVVVLELPPAEAERLSSAAAGKGRQ